MSRFSDDVRNKPFISTFVVWTALALTTASYGPVNAFSSHRHVRQADPGAQSLDFSVWTDLSGRLSYQLPDLKNEINGTMDASERFMTLHVCGRSPDPYELPTRSSVINDLNRMLQGLTCMGRALDIYCLPGPNHTCPPSSSLYKHNVLPGNARRLRSKPVFRQKYQDTLNTLHQVRAFAVGNETDGTPGVREFEGVCPGWGSNAALVLCLSFAHISLVQGFIETVCMTCIEA